MAPTTSRRILVVYSNPFDTDRLRLDKEHRAIDQLLQRLHLDSAVIHRVHASTLEDFVDLIREDRYEIVQFSGHGSQKGIVLEASDGNGGVEITSKRVAAVLREALPDLRAAFFLCCYSADAIPDLLGAAPYLITVSGPADDAAAIEFAKGFYHGYLSSGSIEHAFHLGANCLAIYDNQSALTPVLSRRAHGGETKRPLVQVFPGDRGDSILVDLEEAEGSIQLLGCTRDSFLALLTRKIRIHRWIFEHPRDRAVLSIGPYVGIFSWRNANDCVICHQVLRVRLGADEKAVEAWASLLVTYHDLWTERYRSQPEPAGPWQEASLKRALDDLARLVETCLEYEISASALRKEASDTFSMSKAMIVANLHAADRNFHHGDYPSTVTYLESALSTIHDLIDELTSRLTES